MSASAAIVGPLYDEPSAGGLAPRTLNVMHEYVSDPHGSARRSPDAAPRGKERGSGVFLAGVYTAICLSDIPALPLFRGQKTGTFCFSLQQDRGVRACSPTSMGERCAAVYRGVLTSCLASLERTVPYRRPRGAWRTVTSTSCPNKDRK